MGARLNRETLTRFLGHEMEILRDGPSDPGAGPRRIAGHTANDLRTLVDLVPSQVAHHRLHRVRLTALTADGEALLAEPV